MHVLIILIHLIVCFALIGIILLQSGKGASMGAMFGGAGNQTLFGQTGASTFLGKATTVAAIIFMATSLSLAYISKSGDESVVGNIQKSAAEQSQQQEEPQLPVNEQSGQKQKPSPAEKNPQ
ncbi:MAG: preprotein translocase subunit SecG [Desulfobacteraceae bacterium]|nr:preprotein translocase subunit SecG [Desulfobacteraceae bacterium]MCF8095273.1 preprotein translocase subunit SecG [Desulfobacteraceae bacterium]